MAEICGLGMECFPTYQIQGGKEVTPEVVSNPSSSEISDTTHPIPDSINLGEGPEL